jgi:LuxR family maltose regulon positive regulatory protein
VRPFAEPLSGREAAVLRFLRVMMSTGEIATEPFVSINTVKTDLKSTPRKLGVPGRRRARELEPPAP